MSKSNIERLERLERGKGRKNVVVQGLYKNTNINTLQDLIEKQFIRAENYASKGFWMMRKICVIVPRTQIIDKV